MSYTLDFRPRAGTTSQDEVLEYFRGRPHYSVQNGQAAYSNNDTGVYFTFDVHRDDPGPPDADYPVTFSLNLVRPTFFVLEAETEVTASVHHFDWLVSNPQSEDACIGEYDPVKLISGWYYSNEAGCRMILSDPENRPDFYCLPIGRLNGIWQWNSMRAALQQQVGHDRFVPRISLLEVEGRLATIIVWTDGLPMVFPPVDHVIVYRLETAPHRLFKRTPDFALMPWRDAEALLAPHMVSRPDGAFAIDYETPPANVSAALRSLKPLPGTPELVPMDQVLDSEIAEEFLMPT